MSASRPSDGQGFEAPRLEALARELIPSLYRFAWSLVGDPHVAEDLVQETFLRAIERGHQYRGEGSPAGWLRRILHNLAVDRARRLSREVPTEEEELVRAVEARWRQDTYTVDEASVVQRAQDRAELEDALARLPFIYRAAVVLHDVEGWKVSEFADAAGVTLPAAKQRLRRGRMMLVSSLARGHERREALKGVPMRCWDARRRVSDFLNGDLGPEDVAMLEAHLSTCPTCPPLYAALVGVREAAGGLRDADAVIPPDLAERVARIVGRSSD